MVSDSSLVYYFGLTESKHLNIEASKEYDMSKKISASVSDWVYNDIVESSRPKGISRSEWVEQLIIQGYNNGKKN